MEREVLFLICELATKYSTMDIHKRRSSSKLPLYCMELNNTDPLGSLLPGPYFQHVK